MNGSDQGVTRLHDDAALFNHVDLLADLDAAGSPQRRIEDRIRDLCAKAVDATDGDLEPALRELTQLLRGTIVHMRERVFAAVARHVNIDRLTQRCLCRRFRLLRLTCENLSLKSSGGKQIDNPLNSCVSFVVSGLEVGGRCVELGRCAVKETVGQGATDTLVKKDEQQGNPDAFVSEAIGIVLAFALQ